jgi:CheY-like chemotaxis protein
MPIAALSNTETILLLVEDEAALRMLAATVLRDDHFCVLEAYNAEEALKVASSQKPIHLLLTDVEMGAGLNGIELASRMVTDRPGLRVLVMSGFAANQSTAEKAGFPFLAKPFTPATLRQRVQEVLASTYLKQLSNNLLRPP